MFRVPRFEDSFCISITVLGEGWDANSRISRILAVDGSIKSIQENDQFISRKNYCGSRRRLERTITAPVDSDDFTK
jgi:hypothetical protein